MPIFLLDVIVVVLLSATIFYCWLLNKRLGHWRREEHRLRDMITDFDKASRRAETSLEGLRQTGESVDSTLRSRMREARALSDELKFMIENIDSLTAHFDQSSRRSLSSDSSNRLPAKIGGALKDTDVRKQTHKETNDVGQPATRQRTNRQRTNRQTRAATDEESSEISVKSRAERELLKALRSEKQ